MKKLICFASVLAFLCAGLAGCVSIEFNGLHAQTPEVTDSSHTPQLETPDTVVPPTETPAPVPVSFNFDTVDLDGDAVNTRKFAAEHELTLVNFWATWCGPCVGEMPELQSLHERFSTEAAEADVAILGVWLDTENAGDLDAVLEYTGAAYPIVEFRDEMQNAVELQYIPATIFLNKDGDIVGKPSSVLWMWRDGLRRLKGGLKSWNKIRQKA